MSNLCFTIPFEHYHRFNHNGETYNTIKSVCGFIVLIMLPCVLAHPALNLVYNQANLCTCSCLIIMIMANFNNVQDIY